MNANSIVFRQKSPERVMADLRTLCESYSTTSFDTRGLANTQAMQVLGREQASVALTPRLGLDEPEIAWALKNKLGVVVEDRYVPLATADPELLQAFEDDVRHSHGDNQE